MDPFPLSRIAEFANGKLETGDANLTVSRISTDSRTIQPGDLFVPIRGENFDGRQFVRQTAEGGAVGALVDESWREEVPQNFALIRVADTLAGYQNIAAAYRRHLGLKVVGITGSNGKTTTKD